MLFQSYYDASGSESSPENGLTVVGLVATEAKWLRFQRAWEQVLDEHGITAHHMRHFAGSSPKSEFASWKADDPRRASYVAALIKALKQGMHKGFVVTLEPSALLTVNQEVQFGDHGYALAANLCRRYVEQWAVQKHPAAELQHIFEDGDNGRGVLRDLAAFSDIVDGLRFPFATVEKVGPDGQRVRQFEAADLVAWEARRMVIDAGTPGRSPRRSLIEIARMLPLAGTTLTAAKILPICRKRPDLYPPRPARE
jgi:hypothetical protein